MKQFAWVVCNDMGHNYASTSGNFKAISSSSLSFGGGIGEKVGEGGVRSKVQSMSILKDLIVAAKRFKLIIMF